jgi:O-antigen/teichoic acid export membrane protein
MPIQDTLRVDDSAEADSASEPERNEGRDVAKDITRGTLNLLMLYVCVTLFGFAFWAVAAKWYSINDVGHATVAYSVVGLASSLSLMGTNWWVVRSLPAEPDKAGLVNEALMAVSIVTAIMAVPVSVFMVGYDLTKMGGEDLAIIVTSTLVLLLPSAFYLIFTSVLIGLGKSNLALILNLIANGIRIPAVIALSCMGPSGMILALASSTCVGVVIGIIFVKSQLHGYKVRLRLKLTKLRDSLSYVTGNFANSTLNMVPGTILPMLVAVSIGSEVAASFYYCWLMTTMLQAVSNAVTTSFIVGCASPGSNIRYGLFRSARLIAILLIPSSLGILLARNEIARFLGDEYSIVAEAIPYFVVLGLVLSINVLIEGLLRLRNDSSSLALMALTWAAGAIALVAGVLCRDDLVSISVALIISAVMASTAGISLLVLRRGRSKFSQ